MDCTKLLEGLPSDLKVLHISRWAVTASDGENTYKIFLVNNSEKILKETRLLRELSGLNVCLFENKEAGVVYAQTPFIKLKPLLAGEDYHGVTMELRSILRRWSEASFIKEYVDDDWNSLTAPYLKKEIMENCPEYQDCIDYLSSLKATQFIHGDFTLSNVFRRTDGRVAVLDYENAGFGPKLWDEATMIYSLVENGWVEAAKHLYKEVACPYELLYSIAVIRLARARRKEVGIQNRVLALKVIESFE